MCVCIYVYVYAYTHIYIRKFCIQFQEVPRPSKIYIKS